MAADTRMSRISKIGVGRVRKPATCTTARFRWESNPTFRRRDRTPQCQPLPPAPEQDLVPGEIIRLTRPAPPTWSNRMSLASARSARFELVGKLLIMQGSAGYITSSDAPKYVVSTIGCVLIGCLTRSLFTRPEMASTAVDAATAHTSMPRSFSAAAWSRAPSSARTWSDIRWAGTETFMPKISPLGLDIATATDMTPSSLSSRLVA